MDRKRTILEGTAYIVDTNPKGYYADLRQGLADIETLRDAGLWVDYCPPDYVRGENPPADCYSCTEYESCPQSPCERGGVLVTIATIFSVFTVLALLYYIGDAFWKSVMR